MCGADIERLICVLLLNKSMLKLRPPNHAVTQGSKVTGRYLLICMRGSGLTGRWRWRSFWKDLWVKGQSQSRSGRGRIPAAGCEGSWAG